MANRASRSEDALFVKDGVPVKFCLHDSVTQGRGQITRDVERHGGQIVRDERLANVLLINEQENIAFFRRRYYSSTELYRLSLYVEPRGFVQTCIRAGTYRHLAAVRQGMPGRARAGGPNVRRARVPFTEEDRDHLAYYLATRCPTRDGRMGRIAYTDLERLGQTEDRSWEWARRHTHHSWREHYKMNSGIMDVRIDYYLRQLEDIGHHIGHDPRRRNHERLELQEEEEEEEENDEYEEEEEQERAFGRQDHGRRERARPVIPERRPDQVARNDLARNEQEVTFNDHEDSDDIQEVVVQEPHHVKRHRVHSDAHNQRGFRETQTKRARAPETSANERRPSSLEAGRGEGSAAGGTDGKESEETQSSDLSDLFGDRAFGKLRFDIGDGQEIDAPRASPVPERDGPPPSTQATLIASPRSAEKELPLTSAPSKVVNVTLESNVPPNPQQIVAMTRERPIVQPARVRGASAQPGPSIPKKTRGAAAVDGPYRNTRARSRSVDPQSEPDPKFPRQRKKQAEKGKGRSKQKRLDSIEEDIQVEEGQREGYTKEARISIIKEEMAEDEMAVEGLLEATAGGAVDEDGGSRDGVHDQKSRNGQGDEDENENIVSQLPRHQDIEIEDEPSDSDDAETHASLVRGVALERSAGGGDASEEGESRSDQGQGEDDGDSNDDDTDRIERMANGALYAAPAPASTLPRTRVAHSIAATQQISPRRTRSGNQVHANSGTKARAVVDHFQEEERRAVPPSRTRAAKVAKGRDQKR